MLPPLIKAGQIQQLKLCFALETGQPNPRGNAANRSLARPPSREMLPIEGRHLSFPGARVAALPICPCPARRSAKRQGWQPSYP